YGQGNCHETGMAYPGLDDTTKWYIETITAVPGDVVTIKISGDLNATQTCTLAPGTGTAQYVRVLMGGLGMPLQCACGFVENGVTLCPGPARSATFCEQTAWPAPCFTVPA